MKFYVFALSIFCLTVVSCKKDRTCNCTVITSGVKTTHNQTAGNTINIPPLPPVVIVPATDTTYSNSYSTSSRQITSYNKVSKKSMNTSCAASFEETTGDVSLILTPGTSTVTTTDAGLRKYTCKIE